MKLKNYKLNTILLFFFLVPVYIAIWINAPLHDVGWQHIDAVMSQYAHAGSFEDANNTRQNL